MCEHFNPGLALAFEMRKGVNTEVRPAKVPASPLPLLRVPVGGVEPGLDEDGKVVRGFARRHPQDEEAKKLMMKAFVQKDSRRTQRKVGLLQQVLLMDKAHPIEQ